MKKFLSILLCVCLMFTTVVAVPSVSAEEQAKEYDYIACDYENLADVDTETWFGKGDAVTASLETEAPINGSASLKISKNATGYGGFSVFPDDVALKAGAYYRVTATAQVQSGSFNLGKLGNMGIKADGSYNWAHINIDAAYTGNPDNGGTPLVLWTQWVEKGASAAFTKQGTIKISENKQYSHLGVAVSAEALDETTNEASMLIDNVVAAEIIDTVSVANSDEAKGTATVVNKNENYTDYAMGETAVFTATPAEGYSFKGWYNGDVLVSTDATYEHTLTGDTTLTAKWKLYEKEYFYHFNDFESLTNDDAWLALAKQGTTMTVENGANVISGSQSLKTTTSGSGYSGFALSNVGVGANLKTRVSFDYKVTVGTKGWSGVGYIGYTKTTNSAGVENVNCYNWSTINGGSYSDKITAGFSNEYAASATIRSFKNTITRNDNGSYPVGIFVNDKNAPSEIIFDNVKIAEIIDTVAVVNSDEAKGTVSVANKESKYTDYAKGEVAVFTAVPNNGYYLEGWYNANGEKVSTDKVYEVTLTTDTNLTAKFAAYDTLYTISFNTNGGNEIQSITNGAGADITFPEKPTKEGYTFVGWYADVDCTTPFTATTMPEENTTVFAKWIVGSYVDFENFEGTPTGNFTVMNDAENAYSGNGYLKYSAAAKDNGSRITLTDGKAIKDFALPGDKIEISFKYKFLSGDARFYMHTSAQPDKVALTNRKQEGETKDLWINNYVYKNTIFATVSEEWQTLTVVYDLKNLNQAATERFTTEDYLYSVLFLISDNGAELYIDDVTLSLVPGEHVKTAYNNAAALRSAEASSTGKNGLRIYNEIDTHWAEDKNIVEYGSVAAFASNINGEITVENGKKGVAYSDGTLSAEKLSAWEVTEHTVVFTSYLTNIGTLRYGEDILIRSYAIAADGTVYYGKTATVSVFDVANAIDNAQTADGSEVSTEDSNAFYAFVNSANKSAYEAWCTENGKTFGALYSAKY